jgi:hypothetical protein
LPPRRTPQLGGAQHSARAARPMTEMGQTRPSRNVRDMSVVPSTSAVILQCREQKRCAIFRHSPPECFEGTDDLFVWLNYAFALLASFGSGSEFAARGFLSCSYDEEVQVGDC